MTSEQQPVIDLEHLRLLAIFHYISGGLTLFFSVIVAAYLLLFTFVIHAATQKQNDISSTEAQTVLLLFGFIFGVLIVLSLLYGIAQILSGRFIKQQRYRIFSLIVAAFNLTVFPLGTILGVFTFIVLTRHSVTSLYKSNTLAQ